jgi:hypothetical protein
MDIMKKLSLLFFIWFFSSASYSQNKSDIELLLDWMCGSFNSGQQSLDDSDYYNVALEMHRIWNDRKDGYWIYVEQAISDTKQKPYRQRIYHLVEDDEKIRSIVYTLKDEKKFVGGYNNPSVFDFLNYNEIELKEGCDVIISRKDETTFIGSTVDDNCPSRLSGATYATTKVVIKENVLISWDQGFNQNHEQVWGAVKGGYIFNKIKKIHNR